MCNDYSHVMEGSCDGFGCCQTAIPKNLRKYNVTVDTYKDSLDVRSFSPCGYAFIGIELPSDFSRDNLTNMLGSRVRTIIDWAVWNQTCQAALGNLTSYACKDGNSRCYNPPNINGYRCTCSNGFQRNPYIPNGCQDIDECKHPEDNMCSVICENTVGSYTCSCPGWFHGDGRRDGDGCLRDYKILVKITSSVSGGILIALFMIGFMYLIAKKRNLVRLKEKYFKQNGGLLLQQQLGGGHASSSSRTRIFTAEELKKATDDYSETRILGRGGHGTVYKGVLPDNLPLLH